MQFNFWIVILYVGNCGASPFVIGQAKNMVTAELSSPSSSHKIRPINDLFGLDLLTIWYSV
jgi:hypothetical protein